MLSVLLKTYPERKPGQSRTGFPTVKVWESYFFVEWGQNTPLYSKNILVGAEKLGVFCPSLSYFVIVYCNPCEVGENGRSPPMGVEISK